LIAEAQGLQLSVSDISGGFELAAEPA
jgi:hypothetical protein